MSVVTNCVVFGALQMDVDKPMEGSEASSGPTSTVAPPPLLKQPQLPTPRSQSHPR